MPSVLSIVSALFNRKSLAASGDNASFISYPSVQQLDNGLELTTYASGGQEWRLDGKLHCVDGPAKIDADGTRHWFQYGQYHRDDAPAWESPTGSVAWFKNGVMHRDDGPAAYAASEENNGDWRQHGKSWPNGPETVQQRRAEAAVRLAKPLRPAKPIRFKGSNGAF